MANNNTKNIQKQIASLTEGINRLRKSTKALEDNTAQRTEEISTAINQLNKQQEVLEHKRNILITRNRMVQLSQDRNYYKHRLINTLFSIIVAFTLIFIIGANLFKN